MPGKRRHKRIIKRLNIEFYSKASNFRGTSSNLSESGLFLRTIKPLPVDSQVEISIKLPDNTVSKIKGTVRWSLKSAQRTASRSGMGIEIIEYDQHYAGFLNTLLPPEEQILFKEHRKVVQAPSAKIEHISRKVIEPVPPPKSPPAATRKNYIGTKDNETKDNEIDSLISSLFSNDGKKQNE